MTDSDWLAEINRGGFLQKAPPKEVEQRLIDEKLIRRTIGGTLKSTFKGAFKVEPRLFAR